MRRLFQRSETQGKGGRTATFLAITLVLATALAYQAIAAARSQRATASAVLRDYASFAAEQYAQRMAQDLEYYGVYPIVQAMRTMPVGPGFSFPDPDTIRPGASRSLRRSLDLVAYPFWIDLESGAVAITARPDDPDRPNADALREIVREHHDASYDSTWSSAALIEDNVVYATLEREDETSEAQYAIGFITNRNELERYFTNAFERSPLIPTTLTGDLPSDSVLAMTISTLGGEDLFTVAPARGGGKYQSSGIAYPLGPRFGDIVVHVAIQPGMESTLIIGGLPGSRLPLTVLLALLTAGLIVVTLLKLHRERELARLRTEFVSNVSHELRTPLAQIRMFAETLLLGRVRSSTERDRALTIIDKEARRLTTLVENVLHFSRAERQAVQLAPEETELPAFLDEVVESFRPLATTHDVTIGTVFQDATATVDRGAVRQIVLNLLDNALKYGPQSQTVQVELKTLGSFIQITVEDEGPGIPFHERERIWGRFSRLDRDREAVTAGTGIGLAVVRELTTLHGGTCRVENGNDGARFVVELPVASESRTEAEVTRRRHGTS